MATQFQASTRAALIYVHVLASFPVESTLLLPQGPTLKLRLLLNFTRVDSLICKGYRWKRDCIVCLEMRADELMRRLISGELANYSVVRTSPEPLHHLYLPTALQCSKFPPQSSALPRTSPISPSPVAHPRPPSGDLQLDLVQAAFSSIS
jgi:hypothetical protein